MAKGLTDKQRRILEFIIDFQKENGFPPTIREIGDTFAIGSLRGVTVHLDALKRKGFLTRDRTSRSIRITAPDPRDPTGGSGRDRACACRSSVTCRRPAGMPPPTPAPGRDSRYIETYVSVPEMLSAPATRDGFLLRIGAAGIRDEPILPAIWSC
jgi:repressor LexA